MAFYNIIFKPSVQKDLRPLPKSIILRAMKRIEQLADQPFPHGVEKLAGAERLYRIRVGDYRVVYEVDMPAQEILILYVRHRREVYRSL